MFPEQTGPIYVLHVDDDPDFGELAATFLEQEHDRLEVYTVTTPKEGLAVLDDWAIECVISDYEMSEQDGLEFLSTVREQYPALPFILYTARESEALARTAIANGATGYVQKRGGTNQYATLASRITDAVEQRRRDLERQPHRDADPVHADNSLLDDVGW
jgi:DNA-binding NtrC family response regulator